MTWESSSFSESQIMYKNNPGQWALTLKTIVLFIVRYISENVPESGWYVSLSSNQTQCTKTLLVNEHSPSRQWHDSPSGIRAKTCPNRDGIVTSVVASSIYKCLEHLRCISITKSYSTKISLVGLWQQAMLFVLMLISRLRILDLAGSDFVEDEVPEVLHNLCLSLSSIFLLSLCVEFLPHGLIRTNVIAYDWLLVYVPLQRVLFWGYHRVSRIWPSRAPDHRLLNRHFAVFPLLTIDEELRAESGKAFK
jgi:hypothetical protein